LTSRRTAMARKRYKLEEIVAKLRQSLDSRQGMTNALYYGDNLAVLRESIADESVDLIYLDPPFNSNASYNVLFKAPSAQRQYGCWNCTVCLSRLARCICTATRPHLIISEFSWMRSSDLASSSMRLLGSGQALTTTLNALGGFLIVCSSIPRAK